MTSPAKDLLSTTELMKAIPAAELAQAAVLLLVYIIDHRHSGFYSSVLLCLLTVVSVFGLQVLILFSCDRCLTLITDNYSFCVFLIRSWFCLISFAAFPWFLADRHRPCEHCYTALFSVMVISQIVTFPLRLSSSEI